MYIIIPSYEPDNKLITLVAEIQEKINDANIVVVDDGSGQKYHAIFDKVENMGARLLQYDTNKGKGAALKTAFSAIQDEVELQDSIITIDSDGQHLIKDMLAVAEESQRYPEAIILGSREFVGKVPFRSRFGNKMTSALFRVVSGQKIGDTQTGLRAFTSRHLTWLLSLPGDRFEYEFNQLLDAKKSNFRIREVTIDTVYLEENKGSHFHPIKDSIRIYTPFVKYIFQSKKKSITKKKEGFVLNQAKEVK